MAFRFHLQSERNKYRPACGTRGNQIAFHEDWFRDEVEAGKEQVCQRCRRYLERKDAYFAKKGAAR